MKIKEILMQWVGETKEDRICLGIGYLGVLLLIFIGWVLYIL